MNFVERLLTREEIDSLELDLAHAREANDGEKICTVSARIARLESALISARRGDAHFPGRGFGPSFPRAA